jgi:hypothetical protein
LNQKIASQLRDKTQNLIFHLFFWAATVYKS